MKLDKELYKKAFESFRQWDKAQLLDHVQNAKRKGASLTGWQQFADLWEFGWQMGLKPNRLLQEQKWRL